MTQESSRISQRNFAAYGNTLVVRPLEQDLWLTFANEINNGSDPPVSESIFCDALLSTVAGDEVKAVLELGVAIEIEITQLLADVCRLPPKTIQKRKFAAKGEWDKFYEKLASWPQKLGLQEAKTFDPTGNFKDWFDVVGDLYRLRGGVAHSGKLSPKMGHSIMKYLMATNVLFDYCREQRKRTGASTYSFPPTCRPFQQILLFREGEMCAESNIATTLTT